ncbi:hypothetical protein Rsub_03269 [Raphidocelis subcapitata]|uniref:Aspartyl/asparaginy/proline hydroxylase domain-containing protein n=1 Tax=Raphidocelis subcapitata TaxID=307507 RepID=A0A2V0NR60_9CHLO|nr:hypothetical protein Rsub_03269 [Raphidocelis subcapitata]|eukprot:GBF90136.1 hypothetical protein Rsub_03269 [Raphidocelis subcapitata]
MSAIAGRLRASAGRAGLRSSARAPALGARLFSARPGPARRPGPGPVAPAAAAAAAAQAQAPAQQQQQQPAPAAPAAGGGDALPAAIEASFLSLFAPDGPAAAPRVLQSWRRMCAGDAFERHWPGLGLQRCASYLPGLPEPPPPFPDPASDPGYSWLLEVEAAADQIIEEFEAAMANPAALEAAGNSVWVPAAREDALAYGPDWRTLVLMDRGDWDKFNSKLFPKTKKIITDLKAPAVEVFFARQTAGTGIASHTDDVNFIQTTHLGLRVPEGDCWMKCGDAEPRPWARGRVVIMDTSFMHETHNGTDSDRYVLIMRHWHPGTTPVERVALQFLCDCVDRGGTKFAANKAAKTLRALGLQSGAGGAAAGAPAAAAGGSAAGGGGKGKGGGGKKKR